MFSIEELVKLSICVVENCSRSEAISFFKKVTSSLGVKYMDGVFQKCKVNYRSANDKVTVLGVLHGLERIVTN